MSILNHPRYGEKPAYLFFESFVLDTIGRLSAEGFRDMEQLQVPMVLKTRAQDWRGAVIESFGLSSTIRIAILDLWYRNQEIAHEKGVEYPAQQFAMDFVDNYFAKNSRVDQWEGNQLEEAKAFIAKAQQEDALKFSCPNCQQHIACEFAWAGQSIQCPSCGQQTLVPEIRATVPVTNLAVPPAAYTPPPRSPSRPGPRPVAARPSFSVVRVAIILGCIFAFLFAAALGWSFYRRSLRIRQQAEWREHLAHPELNQGKAIRSTGGGTPPLYREPKLELPTNAVGGQVGGQDFHYEHASVSLHNFVLREGKYWQPDRQIRITTFVKPEDLAGKTLLVTPDNKSPRLVIQAEWMDESKLRKFATAQNGYSLRMKCGPIENGRMSGSIELRMPGTPTTAIKGDFVAAVK